MKKSKLHHDELEELDNQLVETIREYNKIREKILLLKEQKAILKNEPDRYVMYPHESPKART